jgi:hypothetical protein
MEVAMRFSSARAAAVMIALLAGSQALAAADVVPKFDMARSCKAETAGNIGIGETMESCLRDEQQAHDDLASQWSSFAAQDKSACIRETSTDSLPSYVELQTCLEMASDVRKKK